MWYISFQGEADGGVNNLQVYHDNGKPHTHPDLLPTGDKNPVLRELRGFAVAGDLLYVVNAYKKNSAVLLYRADGKGGYTFEKVFAAGKHEDGSDHVNSIFHPFALTFDPAGNCYVSSQDSNVVTALDAHGKPLPAASYLQKHYPAPAKFLEGTFVASAVGALPGITKHIPPDVPAPQGLTVSYTDASKTKVHNSARGVQFYDGYLYVADEPANGVKVYDGKTGELHGRIEGSNLQAPVQLLIHDKVLLVGSTGNNSVVICDLSKGPPAGVVKPTTYVDGKLKHVSGLAFDDSGYFYAAERKAKTVKKFECHGDHAKEIGTFISGLPDLPEFIVHVPK